MRGAVVVPVLLLLVLGSLPTASAQIHQCGAVDIIFLNPDLQPGTDGIIHASGAFFAQFQVIGSSADLVDNIGFSFGVDTVDFDESLCDNPSGYYYTGQAIQNYRADTDPSDGFFINLQTGLVPDGAYTAAVHAYDADDNELARFWARAVVSNCDTPAVPSTPVERCDGDAAQMQRNDATMPWPIVLPGDGAASVDGFSLEFAEALSQLKVTLNGEDITDQLDAWQGRLWDNDLVPGYGPFGLLSDVPLVQECTAPDPVHQCDYLGEAYTWTKRTLTGDDVLRVEATDLAGNLATKDVHVGSGVTGGAISLDVPVLEWQVDRAQADVAPGQDALFRFTIRNSGGDTGHPFADQEVPPGWDYEWNPPHTPVPSGEQEDQEFLVKVPSNATAGTYTVLAQMVYDQGEEKGKTLDQILFVTVTDGATAGTTTTGGTGPEDNQKSPAPAALPVLLVGLALVGLRRRV